VKFNGWKEASRYSHSSWILTALSTFDKQVQVHEKIERTIRQGTLRDLADRMAEVPLCLHGRQAGRSPQRDDFDCSSVPTFIQHRESLFEDSNIVVTSLPTIDFPELFRDR